MSRRLVAPSALVTFVIAGAVVAVPAAPAFGGVQGLAGGVSHPLSIFSSPLWKKDKDQSPPGQTRHDPGTGADVTTPDDTSGTTGAEGAQPDDHAPGGYGRGNGATTTGDGQSQDAQSQGTQPSAAPEPPTAERGRRGVASTPTGTVLVKAPGASQPVAMTADTPVPTGSTIDASHGTVELETVVDAAGHTQRARFRGTTFRVELSRETGMVDLYLTAKPANCGVHRAAIRAVGRGTRRPTTLWGKDNQGKYRTHGRNSVATVRGTEWSTAETCAGTVTRVMRGAVSVLDKTSGHRTLVRAGHSHLARSGA